MTERLAQIADPKESVHITQKERGWTSSICMLTLCSGIAGHGLPDAETSSAAPFS